MEGVRGELARVELKGMRFQPFDFLVCDGLVAEFARGGLEVLFGEVLLGRYLLLVHHLRDAHSSRLLRVRLLAHLAGTGAVVLERARPLGVEEAADGGWEG